MTTRCRVCIYPDARPDAGFVEGVCSACRQYAARASVNWYERKAELSRLLEKAKKRGAQYDVVVPVSGGKDSLFQVLTMIEMGAKVLAVNAGTDKLSDIGRRNLDNIKNYCDLIEWTPHIEVRKKLVRIGLRQVGDLSWPEHLGIWSIPTRIACAFRIPLVMFGECPQDEYAKPDGVPVPRELDAAWVAEFGGLLGLRLSDVVGVEGLTERDLDVFRFPSDEEMFNGNVQVTWLGAFTEWDGWRNAFIAQQYGFEVLPHPVETSLANYENLDNEITVLRDYLRTRKYGYTRAVDIACNHIRRGRLTREQALKLCERADVFPQTSLGKPIAEVLAYFNLTVEEFRAECDKWAAPSSIVVVKPDIRADGITWVDKERREPGRAV